MTAVLLWAATLASIQQKAAWREVFDRAEQAGKDRAALERCLADIDAEIARQPSVPESHYTRGWIFSRLDRKEEGVKAYERAVELAPRFGDALYNLGVLLDDLKRPQEALEKYAAAVAADPTNVDAAYNAAQKHYNAKNFAKALEYWSHARRHAPEDFDVVKKVLQALHALDRVDEAAKAREELLALRKRSRDPRVQKLREFVFEQFDVAGVHVFAYETIEPAGDVRAIYTYTLSDAQERPTTRIQVVSTPELREAGTPYGLRIRPKGGEYGPVVTTLKELPPVVELRGLIKQLIREKELK